MRPDGSGVHPGVGLSLVPCPISPLGWHDWERHFKGRISKVGSWELRNMDVIGMSLDPQ